MRQWCVVRVFGLTLIQCFCPGRLELLQLALRASTGPSATPVCVPLATSTSGVPCVVYVVLSALIGTSATL
jgi:hypothetical protein